MSTRKGKWVILILAACLCWGGITGCGKGDTPQETKAVEQIYPETEAKVAEQVYPAGQAEDGNGGSQRSLVFGEFTAKDTEHREVTQKIFSECDVTMVYIWAVFSEECIAQLGQLAEISAQYQADGAQDKFQIVGIPIDTLDQSGSASSVQLHEIREIMKESQADFTQIIPSYSLITAKLKEVTQLPEILFVDRNGYQLGESRIGTLLDEGENWNHIIDEMIAAVQ